MTSNQYLNSLSENATRFGMRLQETISERTREFGLNSIATSAAALETPADEKTHAALRKQLEGSSDRDKLDAMKRLVALISKGRNVSTHFASVVKNVASPNLEIRKLVYIYLLRYAEHEPDLALLSINTFQRDLADPNPLIRAMALRVLSGIRVPMIGSIVVLAIRKCAGDASPYVRKAAALAIPKCYELDAAHLPALIQIITQVMLRDRSPLSLGAVAFAFAAVCPTRLELLHPHFRRLCRVLVDVDEWGQVEMMRLLVRYVRVMCVRTREGQAPPADGTGTETGTGVEKGKVEGEKGIGFGYEEELDKDVKLLLESVLPVLQSRNPAVVMAAARVLFHAGPYRYWLKFVQPLLRLLDTSKEVERVVLVDLIAICKTAPELFSPYYTRFLIRSDDISAVKKDKIKILLLVLTLDNYAAIMRELIDCADDTNDEVVSAAIDGVGICARRIPASVSQCLTALIRMIKSRYDMVVSSAVMVLKNLVQAQLASPVDFATVPGTSEQSPLSIIAHLARRIDDIKHGQARACVVWLVGQYAGADVSPSTSTIPGVLGAPEGMADWAPDVLRKLAKSFAEETVLVKLQVVTLAAKLFVLSPFDRRIGMLTRYVFSLARYDVNYDLRDRGRMLSALLAGLGLDLNGESAEERGGVVLRREQVKLVLFEGKEKTDETKEVVHGKPKFITIDEELPDWLEKGVESSLRDSEDDAPAAPPVPTAISSAGPVKSKGAVGVPSPPIVLTPTGPSTVASGNGAKGQFMDLDAFYAEEEKEESAEEESSEEESSEEESSGEEESGSEESSGSEHASADDVTSAQ
ncbi:AP-3 complex subunit beta-2 [Psilocybe cubensis]|uniref:Clathrin/coatomer adaptor adaptin-like N-terminal domain-containing protein n=2 Tax=Psilocybe cubensis TaxID=181762 RepID=A0A8H8CM08_PSICU|nr:AP-3 complex subunit beta-2 [Psilocybe cubensis]KAH9481592.1 AP-3 complex subunit beta-2 [Psilocybe cubensis]